MRVRYLQAVTQALVYEMDRDARTFVIGEDVRHSLRGATRGLMEQFGPERVVDTPISEAGFTGLATGAALVGMRPIVEFEITALIYVAFDQLVDQAQKLRFMTGGQAAVPVTYLVPGSGARPGLAGQHADHPYSLLMHMGMKVIVPSTPYDAKGLLITAIEDDDPVAVFLPAALLGMRGEVPEAPYRIPLGQGLVARPGQHVTVVATGHLVPIALECANALASEGIECEVYDPRTLYPFDREGLLESVRKTGRLVIADDANRTCGWAAEIAATVAEEGFAWLKAPIVRITRADVPVPFNAPGERSVLPHREPLERAIRWLMASSP